MYTTTSFAPVFPQFFYTTGTGDGKLGSLLCTWINAYFYLQVNGLLTTWQMGSPQSKAMEEFLQEQKKRTHMTEEKDQPDPKLMAC